VQLLTLLPTTFAYNIHCPVESPPLSQSSEFLPLALVYHEDVLKAIKCLKPTKSVGFNDTPGYIIKGCSGIFVLVLRYIFNLSLTQQCITHDHVSHYTKLLPNQHDFSKSKSPVTNLVAYLDLVAPAVRSQRQVDAVYFDIFNAFDLVPHNLLLRELRMFGFSDGNVDWFHSYLTTRHSRVRLSGNFPRPFRLISGVLQGSVPGPFSFMSSSMIYVTLLNTANP
jgi:hypothetical protein